MAKDKFVPYNTELTAKARENRKNGTAAEKKFWFEILKVEPFDKYKFSRQKPLLDYIVDFYCSKLKLVIEIDGDTHAERENIDKLRTEKLNRYDIQIIRYYNEDVLTNIEAVYEDLRNKINF